MSIISESLKTTAPLSHLFPSEWKKEFTVNDAFLFNSLDHFKFIVSKLTQKQDNKCDITYAKALDMLIRGESDFKKTEQESIRNLVRKNLLKRGLITEEIYENFRYSADGTQVGLDVAKYASGEPECVITPSVQYIDFFYELYVSVSYPWSIPNDVIKENVAKLLATVEELERQHIFIKITAVAPVRRSGYYDNGEHSNMFAAIPLFSHKEVKSVETMSSVVNEKLFRKFIFAVMENFYGDNIGSGYGYPEKLPKTINIGETLNEVELFENIVQEVGK